MFPTSQFLQLIFETKKESRRSYPSSEFGMVENGTSRDFTSRVVGPRNPKLVRHDDEIDQKGIRHILSTLIGKSWKTDPFFLRNFENFPAGDSGLLLENSSSLDS